MLKQDIKNCWYIFLWVQNTSYDEWRNDYNICYSYKWRKTWWETTSEFNRKDKRKKGIELEAIIEDGTDWESENLKYCKDNGIKNVSKLSNFVTHGKSKRNNSFEYNSNGLYVNRRISKLLRS